VQKWTFHAITLFVAMAVGHANLIAGELEELQGKWEMKFQDNGRILRAIKTVRDDTETVETYDGAKLVHRHVVKIELVETEVVIIIKWGEAETTDGPRKGTQGKPGSCLSKRVGNKWYNVHGLKPGENYAPYMQEFTRLSDED
jgi:hypothetical protein